MVRNALEGATGSRDVDERLVQRADVTLVHRANALAEVARGARTTRKDAVELFVGEARHELRLSVDAPWDEGDHDSARLLDEPVASPNTPPFLRSLAETLKEQRTQLDSHYTLARHRLTADVIAEPSPNNPARRGRRLTQGT